MVGCDYQLCSDTTGMVRVCEHRLSFALLQVVDKEVEYDDLRACLIGKGDLAFKK
jgi:hypothetical protein